VQAGLQCVEIMICATLVNTQTHTQTESQLLNCYTISSAVRAKNTSVGLRLWH